MKFPASELVLTIPRWILVVDKDPYRRSKCFHICNACHILHNTAGKASSAFEAVSNMIVITIITMIIDVVINRFYWFEKSTREGWWNTVM